MENLYKKLIQLSKSNISIQNKLRNKQLVDQMKAIIDQKKQETKSHIHSGVDSARLWMEEFTGLDKVHAAQSDVFHYQNEFIRSQTKRRELGAQLTTLQTELNELHNDIVSIDRRDEKYLQLITREHKLLKLENQLRNDFVLTEAEERENFTLFTTKIKESQDKEREQALRTKYWTIIVSSAVTVIGVLGNGVISFLKMHKIDKTVLLLGEETKTLNQNIHSNIAQLDTSQAQVIALLAQIARKVDETPRTPKGSSDVATRTSVDQSNMLDLVRQANSKLDALRGATKGNIDPVFHRIDASQTEMKQALKQVLASVEGLKNNATFARDTHVSDVGLSDSRTKSGHVNKTASSEHTVPGPNPVKTMTGPGEGGRNGTFRSIGSDSDDGSWATTVVYFGIVTCVLLLLGRVM